MHTYIYHHDFHADMLLCLEVEGVSTQSLVALIRRGEQPRRARQLLLGDPVLPL